MAIDDNKKTEYLKFLKASPPPLVAGKYQVKTSQAIEGKTYQDGQDFYISAPRFKLSPADVQNVYPPNNKEGSFYKSLPHIVFNRKTLPWDRTLDGSPVAPGEVKAPWLALLVLDEDEIKTSNIEIKPRLLEELLNKDAQETDDAKILRPALTDIEPWFTKAPKAGEEKPSYGVIDLPAKLFQEITPHLEDLHFTVHARQIDTQERAASDINAEGWLSVIIANRLPTRNKRNTVYLVSLEGYKAYLGTKAIPANYTKIRLCVLHNWSFTASGPDFESLVTNINEGASLFRIEPDTSPVNPTIKTALDFGYVPVNHHFRDGSDTVSWYRGPLCPLKMSKPDNNYPYESSDALLRYDPNNGLLDTAYSTAWQLGRLLGLQHQDYTKALQNWSEQMKKQAISQKAKPIVEDKLAAASEPLDFEDTLQKMERDDLMQSILFEYFNNS